MQVGKWGDSLAVRLPSSVVELLGLKEGDEIEIGVAGDRRFDLSRDQGQQGSLARLRALQRPLPPGFRFRREDAYER